MIPFERLLVETIGWLYPTVKVNGVQAVKRPVLSDERTWIVYGVPARLPVPLPGVPKSSPRLVMPMPAGNVPVYS